LYFEKQAVFGIRGALHAFGLSWYFWKQADFRFPGMLPRPFPGSAFMVFWKGGCPDTLIFGLGHFRRDGVLRFWESCQLFGPDTT
jgi:hypothetical protein